MAWSMKLFLSESSKDAKGALFHYHDLMCPSIIVGVSPQNLARTSRGRLGMIPGHRDQRPRANLPLGSARPQPLQHRVIISNSINNYDKRNRESISELLQHDRWREALVKAQSQRSRNRGWGAGCWLPGRPICDFQDLRSTRAYEQ